MKSIGTPGFKSGFIGLLGRPNVGKSTLLNRLVGEKIAAVTSRPQTTQRQLRGIITSDRYQMIFVDTPGIHEPKFALGEFMVDCIEQAARDVDLIVFLLDSIPHRAGVVDGETLNRYTTKKPVIWVVNKIDSLSAKNIGAISDFLRVTYPGDPVVEVSAQKGTGVPGLITLMVDSLPEGPLFYPDDIMAVEPTRFIVAEFIRETIINLTFHEIPYGIAVMVEEMKERKKGKMTYVRANIYVEAASQKKIIIGKKGLFLKKIGTRARQVISDFLGTEVYLDLWVKIKPKWRKDPRELRRLGYR